MTNATHDDLDIGFDFEVTQVRPQTGGFGVWTNGTIAGHRFQALVFPDHAECADFELGTSRISKLRLQRITDQTTAANFDRGWDLKPTDDVARTIVGFLEAGIADYAFGE